MRIVTVDPYDNPNLAGPNQLVRDRDGQIGRVIEVTRRGEGAIVDYSEYDEDLMPTEWDLLDLELLS